MTRSVPGPRANVGVTPMPPSPVVLLLVDFINPLDFPGAEGMASAAVAAAQATATLRCRMRSRGLQTVYANDNYGVWHTDFSTLWRGCRRARGAPGELARALAPQARDCTVLKPRHSAFYATPLDLLLRQLQCRRLIVTGLAADNCVLFSAMDAYLRGYELWVPADCVAAETEEAKTQALDHMLRVLKAETRPALARHR